MMRFLSWCFQTWKGAVFLSIGLASLILAAFIGFNGSKDRKQPGTPNFDTDGVLHMVNTFGLSMQINLLSPQKFGVKNWQVGDSAQYRLVDLTKGTFDGQPVTFQVVGKLEPSHAVSKTYGVDAEDRYWLWSSGFRSFRNLHEDVFHLAKRDDLRVSNSKLCFKFQKDYIPLENSLFDHFPTPPFAKLTKLGQQEIETKAGRFNCDHYLAEIGMAQLEVWADPRVSPLGIVRIESDNEDLELVSFGNSQRLAVPKMVEPLLSGISTLRNGCSSCHVSDTECHKRVFPPT